MEDLISRQAAIDSLLSINEVVPKYKLIDKNDAAKVLVKLPSAQPEIIRCKDCIHKPRIASETGDVVDGFDIEFPDDKCPCQCSDEYYNWMPYDDWFCGNGESRTDE